MCEKRFRSAGQLSNHERSKKHLEAVAELRQLLEEEEQDADWLVRPRACRQLESSCQLLSCGGVAVVLGVSVFQFHSFKWIGWWAGAVVQHCSSGVEVP